MSKQPLSVRTEHLLIVPFEKKHLNATYISWLNDPYIMRFSEQRHREHTRTSCENYMNTFAESDNYFLALEDHNGAMLGTMTIYQDLNNGLVDMGIMIGSPQARGKGLGLEAWNAMSDWVISVLKPRKLTAGCMSSNSAMIRIMKENGMKPDGVRVKHFIQDGRGEDIIYMAKFVK